jgi:hypothetical protein
MEFYRFYLGSLSFRIQIDEKISPHSTRAIEIAKEAARALNDKFFHGTVRGSFPPYAVRATVYSIAEGSLAVDVILHADIVAGITLVGLFKFLKDYSDVRKGILEVADDLQSVSSFVTKKVFPIRLHARPCGRI